MRRLGACLLLASPFAASAQAPQTPTFGVSVETVYVDAFVTRAGQHLPGLSASDFVVKDNGVAQEVELVAAETLPLLAVLAFDCSASVAGRKLVELRAAGTAFLDSLRPIDQVGLLSFSAELAWLAGPTGEKTEVRRALERLRAEGATALHDALFAALTLPETRTRKLVVLFSDGEDNLSWLDRRQVMVAAERSNALVHVVALSYRRPTALKEPEHIRVLREIAEATGGRLWESESPERLRDAFAAIAEAVGQRYVLRYEPRKVARPGWHAIDVRLRGREGAVHARRGYWAALP